MTSRWKLLMTSAALAACSALVADPKDAGMDASVPDVAIDAPADAASDAPTTACKPNAPFGKPESLAKLNTSNFDELGGVVSADGSRFYFARGTNHVMYKIYSAPILGMDF